MALLMVKCLNLRMPMNGVDFITRQWTKLRTLSGSALQFGKAGRPVKSGPPEVRFGQDRFDDADRRFCRDNSCKA
jgi:hypothetical protein